MSELWPRFPLEALVDKVGSGSTPKGGESVYKLSGTPLIRSMNVVFFGFKNNGLAFLDEIQAEALKNAEVKAEDVLLNITGASIGRVTLAPQEVEGARVNQHVCIIRPNAALAPRFLNAYLSSPEMQDRIWADNYGVTRQALTKQQILGFNIPLPPLPEQKRIADKLDSVLARVDACRDHLDRLPALLKRFRQSILAAATSGRLTVDWRNTEASSTSWQNTPLGKYVENLDGKRVPISETLRTSRRGQFPYYGASGVIDTIDGYTHDGKFLLIGEDGANLLTRSKPIAFIATGKIWVNNHAHVLKCKHGAPEEYLCYFINSIDLTPYVSGSAQPKLNQKNMNSIDVPVPPVKEQTEIVRRVEILFAFADRLEARLANARRQAGQLTPALLAKAFRGELVAQDPADEPAAELLKRLAAQRETAPKSKRSRKIVSL